MSGKARIFWSAAQMPVLRQIAVEFARSQPLRDVKISACLHVTAETANLVLALKQGGAQVSLCASNPLSTQDDIVASLKRDYQIAVYARRGADKKSYYQQIRQSLKIKPHLTVDDGADLVTYLHIRSRGLLKNVWGGTEETTTGVARLRIMAQKRQLKYPIIAVNSALTKYLFDNRYGTGQSTIDGILRATNVLLAGKVVVVAGYGWCGRGVASRARGMGAQVIITEINAVRALEALMDGYQVMTMAAAARLGDIFVTTTGNTDVISKNHFKVMKSGVILANAGHFNDEINLKDLSSLSVSIKEVRDNLAEYELKNGKLVYLLCQGRLVNLGAAEGHPASVMDMSFANQALALEYLVARRGQLKPAVYPVPEEIDLAIATLKLRAFGVSIDKLTPKQKKYLRSWQQGT